MAGVQCLPPSELTAASDDRQPSPQDVYDNHMIHIQVFKLTILDLKVAADLLLFCLFLATYPDRELRLVEHCCVIPSHHPSNADDRARTMKGALWGTRPCPALHNREQFYSWSTWIRLVSLTEYTAVVADHFSRAWGCRYRFGTPGG